MRADLRQLQALVAIADHGTLGRAADALHCSPSALSMQLSALEARIGQVLTERTGRGLRLSAEGERLLPAARDTVQAAERFTQLARAAPVDGQPAPAVPVVVGTILDPPAIRLGEFLRAVRERGPQLHPELRHGISGSVLREVQEGRVDLGFFLGETDGPGWRVQTLAPVRYVVVAPRGWQSRLEGRRWEDLAALPWIDTPRESVHHALLRPVFGGRTRATVARVDQEASMLDLVRAGFGLSLAREAVALREAHVGGLAVSREHRLDTTLSLGALEDQHDPARAAALDTLFDAAAAVWRSGP